MKHKINNWPVEWEPGTDKRSEDKLKESGEDPLCKEAREDFFLSAYKGKSATRGEKQLTAEESKRQRVLFEALGIPADKIPGPTLEETEKEKYRANLDRLRQDIEALEKKLGLETGERKSRELAETRKKLDKVADDVNLKESTSGGMTFETAQAAIRLHEDWQAGKINFGELLNGLEQLGVFDK
jgi:hypothetical protein